MFSLSFKFLGLILIGLFLGGCILQSRRRRQIHLPPGPSRKPLVGNLCDLPSHDERAWLFWMKHKDLYGKCSELAMMQHKKKLVIMTVIPGPISSLSVLGQTMIILNDAQLAGELLNKHSVIHSCRPKFQFASMSVARSSAPPSPSTG